MGHRTSGKGSGYFFVYDGALSQKVLKSCRLNESASTFFLVAIYLTYKCLLYIKQFIMSNLISFMHSLHPDEDEFTMSLTDLLSHQILILQFCNSSAHVKIPTHKAKSSKYWMLGLNFLMNPGGQIPKFHFLLKKHPKPPVFSPPDASVKNCNWVAVFSPWMSTKGLAKTLAWSRLAKNISHILQSSKNSLSSVMW